MKPDQEAKLAEWLAKLSDDDLWHLHKLAWAEKHKRFDDPGHKWDFEAFAARARRDHAELSAREKVKFSAPSETDRNADNRKKKDAA